MGIRQDIGTQVASSNKAPATSHVTPVATKRHVPNRAKDMLFSLFGGVSGFPLTLFAGRMRGGGREVERVTIALF